MSGCETIVGTADDACTEEPEVVLGRGVDDGWSSGPKLLVSKLEEREVWVSLELLR